MLPTPDVPISFPALWEQVIAEVVLIGREEELREKVGFWKRLGRDFENGKARISTEEGQQL